MRRLIAVFSAVMTIGAFLYAQEASQDAAKKDTVISVTLASSLEAKVSVTKTISLSGDFGKVDFKPTANVSPVSVNAGGDVVYTLPLPLLEFSAGILGGSGWYLSPVGANGVGVYDGKDKDDEDTYTQDAFSHFMYKAKAGAALQFDLAVVIPGDWNHVQFRTYHEIYYRALTGVTSKMWQYENAGGNYNQPKYYSNYILAYALPEGKILSRVGGLFSNDMGLTKKMSFMNAGGIVGLKFNDFFSVDFAALMKNADGDGFEWDKAAFVLNFAL